MSGHVLVYCASSKPLADRRTKTWKCWILAAREKGSDLEPRDNLVAVIRGLDNGEWHAMLSAADQVKLMVAEFGAEKPLPRLIFCVGWSPPRRRSRATGTAFVSFVPCPVDIARPKGRLRGSFLHADYGACRSYS